MSVQVGDTVYFYPPPDSMEAKYSPGPNAALVLSIGQNNKLRLRVFWETGWDSERWDDVPFRADGKGYGWSRK